MKVFIDHKIPLILGEDEKPALKNTATSSAANALNEFEKNCERIRKENDLPEWQARSERYNDGEDDDWRGIEDRL